MKIRRGILIVLACLPGMMMAQERTAGRRDSVAVFQGFSGGVMVHTGYQFGTHAESPETGRTLHGATFGIGGAARVNLWKHLRLGGEGYVSTMPQWATNHRQLWQPGSYVRSGWGGILADACWRGEKIWPYIGGTIGGGAVHSLYLFEGNEDDWIEETHAMVHKQSFFYVDPYVGLDWCMTEKVHLTFRLDWMIAVHRAELVYPTGPRLYVGVMFCH